ncbi:type I DNA topoisomerase [Thermodesulforhabdus norvegica]|uniref:DNA topoisomerase 1 n=1 Tax=Thermodesulforhabdus norvegica TaxID=39841 RepID=A0A1I4S5U4_9BACT|nr:type I DNA topoisomerase [Thermodesulforhabdus norvegica]SFM59878.1 DNA topoisomerase I [Thermodesulforhabdus norvegica]
MGKSLLIVESPTKAKTLNRYLGRDFVVKASKGHIKDLPENKLGVDVSNNFRADYVIIPGKEKIVRELRKAAKEVDRILLGPDPDREGEAIAWHISEEIAGNGKRRKKEILRVLFYELTRKGIAEALERPTQLNRNLYEAQQARRILDRLVGYLISPILWQKIRRGLSAGRVQSVALRLVCEREREIQQFVPREYWTIEALFRKQDNDSPISAKLISHEGRKINIANAEDARALGDFFRSLEDYIVAGIEQKKQRRNPPPPFITSTLQQEASRKLGFSPKRTMTIAQQLYEGVELPEEGSVGLITYMRTDSTRISQEAVAAAREYIAETWGKEYLPGKAREFKSKAGAQDAHEAIRPTDVFRVPEALKPHLTADQYALYELIWKRFVACQMKHAEILRTSVDISSRQYPNSVFRATGSVITFPGFMALYVEEGDDEDAENGLLPILLEGQPLQLLQLEEKQHFTQPPPRYTEANLVKELEQNGVGRPSTYATIVSTIQERGYVVKEGKALKPTELGFVVNDALVQHFPEIVDIAFTAEMEAKLDRIEQGDYSALGLLQEFYSRFKPMLDDAKAKMENLRKSGIPSGVECPRCGNPLVIRLGQNGSSFLSCHQCGFTSDYERDEKGNIRVVEPEKTDKVCEKCGRPMQIKHGRFGAFLACTGYPECKNTQPLGLGINCPADGCDGEIVERRSKKGRVFYGCSRYPACRTVFSSKPVSHPCSKCGYPVTLLRVTRKQGSKLVCPRKECKHSEPIDESTPSM